MIIIFYCISQKDKLIRILDSQVIPRGEEIKTVSLPCIAKLEVIHLLKPVEIGAKGVAVWGCADEDCLYPVGSKVGRGRLSYAQRILKEIGMAGFPLKYFADGLDNSVEIDKQFDNWLRKIFFNDRISISN